MAKNNPPPKSSGPDIADPELQMQRLLSWSTYNDFLKDTDEKLLAQYQKTIRHLQVAFWMSVIMSGLLFILAVVFLIFGVNLFVRSADWQRYSGVAISIISLAVLFYVLYRNPISNIRHSTSNMAKISIILMGYVRQLNQIDIAYKQVLFSSSQVDPEETRKTIQSIQEVVEQSVDEV
ncbi:MAG TPA: hypothetical protein VLA49_07445, partial [Anaerolineales bacterium]|nr:hypothetical protein [Anaerolineales bacterium]